jgi:YHS domain-containing protein
MQIHYPLCGTCEWKVNEHAQEVVGRLDWEGGAYYFCSFQCRQKFELNPSRYTLLSV